MQLLPGRPHDGRVDQACRTRDCGDHGERFEELVSQGFRLWPCLLPLKSLYLSLPTVPYIHTIYLVTISSRRPTSPQLKRLVITSSVAAVIVPEPTGDRHKNGAPYTFTEEDWNTYSPGVIEKEGHEAPGADKYRASKVGRFGVYVD